MRSLESHVSWPQVKNTTVFYAFFTYMKSLVHLIVDLFPEVLANETYRHRKARKKKKAEES